MARESKDERASRLLQAQEAVEKKVKKTATRKVPASGKKPVVKAPARPAKEKKQEMVALIFDTETTGLIDNRSVKIDKQPEVIEFYSVLANLDTGELIEELNLLVRPRVAKLLEKTVAITGITDEMLRDQPRWPEVADRIRAAMEGAPVVIAHNAPYDVDMVDIEMERIEQTVRWPPAICTIEQSQHYQGRRLTLGRLHEHLFGLQHAGAHRAREDVQALLRICIEMRKRGDL